MSRHVEDEDWDDGEWDGDEDEPATIDCPHCGEEILEDAQRCPACGNYLSDEDAPAAARPWWMLLGAGLCLYVVWRWIVG